MILLFAPHVDDEVLGCSSWLAADCHVVWFGAEAFREVSRDDRLAEAEAVSRRAGFSFTLLDEPVNEYRVRPLLSIAEQAVNDHRPDTVLLPWPSYNQDHRAVHEAVRTAVRPHDRIPRVRRVLCYEQPHVALWPREPFAAQYFRPIDIERKLELWHLHRSQNRGHRSDDHIRSLAVLRGQQSQTTHAEAFQILRWVEP